MLDEAQQEARRLAASLGSINRDAAESANTVVLALQSKPKAAATIETIETIETLETIDEQLPKSTALVRVRLPRVQGLVNAMLDDNLPPCKEPTK